MDNTMMLQTAQSETKRDNAGKYEQEWQISAALDQYRSQEAIQAANNNAPDQQDRGPYAVASPVHPAHSW